MEIPESCSRCLLKSWNQFGKLLGVRSTVRKVKKDSKAKYPYLFDYHLPNLGDEIHLKGGRIVTPQNLPLLEIELK